MATPKGSMLEPIAIIGSSCRFPGGASSPSKLWDQLQNPRDLRTEIPLSRFNVDTFYHENGEYHGSTNVRYGYLCDEDPRHFDHTFFNIHPKEAESMDPQQRIFLELVYEGIESAGYSMHKLRGTSTGVFVGQMTDDYYDVVFRDIDTVPQYAGSGVCRAIVANRVSYFFDWKGPSLNVDTACSSSLVALHYAVQSLRSGESQLAVVGGVNLILGPERFITESKLHMLSPNGRSRMWDADADGYARGEGFATVVLKTLSQALADGDHVETIIRETGVNQDGRSTGLTVPSSVSQAALIRSTYTKCGLDYRKFEDRCQYFEAHGTGTTVGDPKEAEAISRTFFPDTAGTRLDNSTMYVGSIKSVIGHSEGAAGIASILKASLAIQRGAIPPNLHFEHLNPNIEPFYENLCVPTKLIPWPDLPLGVPRRASINSFGFGGTNAHAIIESWGQTAASSPESINQSHDGIVASGPVLLSANSKTALRAAVQSLLNSISTSSTVDFDTLAWTSQTRRTEFSHKIAFSELTAEELRMSLRDYVETSSSETTDRGAGTKIMATPEMPLRILGVFTGQGAQWPGMGTALYRESSQFRLIIQDLDESLQGLHDRPDWSLGSLMQESAQRSSVHSAEISQPLTTAIQIALVELLKACRVSFAAVVGHSSGEIAAAYASGYINGSDAIRIAYYRGVHSKYATGGKMLAVGMSYDQALVFCRRQLFLDRLQVAASNSSSSCTLSGDADAVEEARDALHEANVFARVLNVEKAYHSHHMEKCSSHYLDSLRDCQILLQGQEARRHCKWYSSVHGSDGSSIDHSQSLSDSYWVDNMLRPVLFHQAVERAIREDDCFDFVVEVGPHPALKGPVSESLKNLTGRDIPYHGVATRNLDDRLSLSKCLASLWEAVDGYTTVVDFNGLRRVFDKPQLIEPAKNLLTYAWDHKNPLLAESKSSRQWRTASRPMHELLGRLVPSSSSQEIRWRNVLTLKELGWLRGHQFQGQVLFPAAGYIVMALDAARRAIVDPIDMVELNDLQFLKAITLEANDAGSEINFVLKLLQRDANLITSEFYCYGGAADGANQETNHALFTGKATVYLGHATRHTLPARVAPRLPLTDVNLRNFYQEISNVGLDYSDDFVVSSIRRRLSIATVTVDPPEHSKLHLHPATLDAAFHGVFAAFSYPGDGSLWAPYLPTSVASIRVNMSIFTVDSMGSIVADSYLRHSSTMNIQGDVDLFSAKDEYPQVQIQGLVCSTIALPSPDQDRGLFARTVWKRDISSGLAPLGSEEILGQYDELYDKLERTSYYFLKQLVAEVSREEVSCAEPHFNYLLEWAANYVIPLVRSSQHPTVKFEWDADPPTEVIAWKNSFPDCVDLQLIHKIGENLPSIVRGQTSALQLLTESDGLTRLYKDGFGLREANQNMAKLVGQISHRFPNMKILEVGAGTGATTSSMIQQLDSAFESYTFTDISAGFFATAQERFSSHESKMHFKVLDIEHSPANQGFQEHSFDLVIASNVLHATKSLSDTLNNCRKLLKPGGRMVILELTGEMLYAQLIMGGLPGWWRGRDDGRMYHPTIDQLHWDEILRENGFSGVDFACNDMRATTRCTFAAMVSQAVDDRVNRLRQPLAMGKDDLQLESLLIVGGMSSFVSHVASQVQGLLEQFSQNTIVVSRLEDVPEDCLLPGSAVVILSDTEESVFRHMDAQKLRMIQTIFDNATHVLWAVQGLPADDPYASMILGVGRSVMMESPHLNLQFVELTDFGSDPNVSSTVATMLLQMALLRIPENDDILWTFETEVKLSGGASYIPRVVLDDALNLRFNAGRRNIQKNVALNKTPVSIVRNGTSLVLEEREDCVNHSERSTLVEVEVSTSSFFSLSTQDGEPFYICLGSIVGSGRQVLALSPTNSSIVVVTHEKIFETVPDGSISVETLLSVLLCKSIVSGIQGTLWIHNAPSPLASMIRRLTQAQGSNVFLSESISSSQENIQFVHERTTWRDLKTLIPDGLQRFVDMGFGNKASAIANTLDTLDCRSIVEIQQLYQKINQTDSVPLNFTTAFLHELLRNDFQNLLFSVGVGNQELIAPIPIDAVCGPRKMREYASSVKWDCTDTVPVTVNPISSKSLFSGDKTYFLIGLTSELGMSLVAWMLGSGAKYFALGSRTPKVNEETIKHLTNQGARIKIFAFDVADREALQAAHGDIVASMPPIGGVVNAAMVLRDKPFTGMSLETLEAVLRPKVIGSRNLDELFYDTELDFFVLFGSMASVFGNQGQANYGAANLFMTSLVAQRRSRGAAGSILDIAMLMGIGYVARSGITNSTIEAQLRKFNFMAISETDFHHMFAEAVRTGMPNSGLGSELLNGLRTNNSTPWRHIPRFSHFAQEVPTSSMDLANSKGNHSISKQLEDASSSQEKSTILDESICSKLVLILRMPRENIDTEKPLNTLGIDSLVAVELRSWLLKKFNVDLPIFKLLGGASVKDISIYILARIAEDPAIKRVDKDVEDRVKQSMPRDPGAEPPPDDETGSSSSEMIGTDVSSAASSDQSCTDEQSLSDDLHGAAEGNMQSSCSPSVLGKMTHAQERLYFLHEFLDDKSTYNVGYIGEYHGDLDCSKLETALQIVSKHHESLRSSYYIEQSTLRAYQAVNPEPNIILDHKVIFSEEEARTELEALKSFVFNIEEGTLMKILVLRRSEVLSHVAFLHHHIAIDGHSWHIFLRDLNLAYNGMTLPIAVQAMEVAKKERLSCTESSLQGELAYWEQLHQKPSGPLPLFPFSLSRTRNLLRRYDTTTHQFELDKEFSRQVKSIASRLHITPFHFYLSSLAFFLARCLKVQDFGIGIVDANRTRVEDESAVGYFLNMLPLRFQLQENDCFESVSKCVRDMALAALENCTAPFDMILDRLEVSRSGTHHPLFQVALNYRNGYSSFSKLGDGAIEWTEGITARNPFDIAIDITEISDRTIVHLTSQKYLYSFADSKRILTWYVRAMEALVQDPSLTVATCPISNNEDSVHAHSVGKGDTIPIKWDGTLLDRIMEMTLRYPNHTALKAGLSGGMTYAQMNARALQISASLQECDISLGSHVAILLSPTSDYVCCVLAVMRLGLVWVPLDTRNPLERLQSMVTDCEPKILVYANDTKVQADMISVDRSRLLNIDHSRGRVDQIENRSRPDKPAVILYTSGSTGTPKGVVLPHAALLRHIHINTETYQLGQEIVLQQSSTGFDVSLDQTFHALANGGTLVIVTKEGRGDPTHIAELMLRENITFTTFCPSEYTSLLNYGSQSLKQCKSWRFAFSLGEKLPTQLQSHFFKLELPKLQLVDSYGPTEGTISCAKGLVPCTDELSHSCQNHFLRPMPNHWLTIVDEQMKVLPIGFPGEVCIIGDSLATGYLNRPEETSGRFLETNLGIQSQAPQRVYRTGDLGRLLDDGSMTIYGRIDGDLQVKIRGYRVELDEISTVILNKASDVLAEVAVSYRPDTHDLVAFVVFKRQFRGSQTAFVDYLRTDLPLPAYMCPTVIQPIQRIPTTINGKQDRQALDAIRISDIAAASGVSYNALSASEFRILNIWKDVILTRRSTISQISADSDFFQIGGNSMLAIKLRSVFLHTFGITPSLPELFQLRTLHNMAAWLDGSLQDPSTKDFDLPLEVDSLMNSFSPAPELPIEVPVSGISVLLTGATGFLGSHILKLLASNDRINKIYCVAIRPNGNEHRRQLSVTSDKIIEFPGDLADETLGLPESVFHYLSHNVHAIIHNGAEVSYLKSYDTLRRVNVVSTSTLIKLSLPRRIPFHFISTAAVASATDQSKPLLEVSVSNQVRSFGALDGYALSKLTSESLLEGSAARHGLPVWVHRPTSIVGNGAPAHDIMASLIEYSRKLAVVPLLADSVVRGHIDLVRVEDVSSGIVEACVDSTAPRLQQCSVTFTHYCDIKIPLEGFDRYMGETVGGAPFKQVSVESWLNAARDRDLSPTLYNFLIGLLEAKREILLPWIDKSF